MNLSDWLWTLGSILLIGISTAAIIAIASSVFTDFSPSPPFLSARILPPNERWILLCWIPFFFFNIVGEEIMWRGYIFPRQELTHGKKTWLVHGSLWWVFHLSFGWHLLLMLLPIIFMLSWVVQHRRNTWSSLLIHGIINGGGFLAISLGWVS
ncbi:CPBP family intramembrane glutamic endopeptidase [Zarconia navalis]|nr:CPBP family intramembrane glutamic endopeptidase [Zarconia navalis]